MDDGIAGIALDRQQWDYRSLGLTAEDLLEWYRLMLLTRALDDRIWALNRAGKIPISGPCSGHEAAQVASIWAMDRQRDWFFTNYRNLCANLALGVSPQEVMLGYMGKAGDPFSGGRQFPLHGAYPRLHIVNLSNVVATQVPQAVGAALALKMRREPGVVLVYFGDGATSEGETHEGMNFAGVHRLPIVFFCENNRYAISVPQRRQMAIENVADRARGYGFEGVVVDGTNPVEVYRRTLEAARKAREGGGPTLIEAKVERLRPHTTDDDDRRYRTPEEMEEARRRDPIPLLQRFLMEEGLLTPERDAALRQEVQAEVDRATELAEAAPFPDARSFHLHLYATPAGRRG